MQMKRKKGSFTIEASILIPFILFLMMTILQMGISFYQNSVNREIYAGFEELDAVAAFYKLQVIKEAGEELLEDE